MPNPDFRAAGSPASSDDEVIRRVQRTVLQRIAIASTPQHLTLHSGTDGWQPFLDGIECKVLLEQGDVLSYLLRLAPGAVIPAHRHPVDEECMVLSGELRIGADLTVRAGDYHLGKAGVLHAPITSEQGALVFLRGAAPEPSHFL